MLRKNVAGQSVFFVLISVSTGAPVTGASVAVQRALDTAAQAAATGTVTELGSGQYRFDASQADTNADFLGYLFSASGAISVGANFVTTANNPHDAATAGITNLDAAISSRMATYVQPAGFLAATFPLDPADQSLIIAATDAIMTSVAGVQSDTDNIQTRLPAALVGGRMDASAGAMAADVLTAAATAPDFGVEVGTAVWATAARTLTSLAGLTVDTVTTLTNLPAIPVNWLTAAGIAAGALNGKGDWNIGKNDYALSVAGVDVIWDEVVDGVRTARESTRLWNSGVGAKSSGLDTTTAVYRDLADTKDRITATVDAFGNRSAVVLDLS